MIFTVPINDVLHWPTGRLVFVTCAISPKRLSVARHAWLEIDLAELNSIQRHKRDGKPNTQKVTKDTKNGTGIQLAVSLFANGVSE
jgi:hypothetical protein